MRDLQAPGQSALWTEAALRCLGSTAFLIHEDGSIAEDGGVIDARVAKDIALDAMAIATAFERACIEVHRAAEAKAAADAERVRVERTAEVLRVGRYAADVGGHAGLWTVAKVVGERVLFAPGSPEYNSGPIADLCDVVSGTDGWTPAPLSAEGRAMSADDWTEAHELAALERLFEVGLAAMRQRGSSAVTKAVRLTARATSTRSEFESALRTVMVYGPPQIRTEVAHVYRVVAERIEP